VHIEPETTALVGRNEAGKTAFLEGVRRLSPIDGVGFDLVHDYPRHLLGAYRGKHPTDPDIAVSAKLVLDDDDVREVERRFGRGVLKKRVITVKRDYLNRLQVQADLDESALVRALVASRDDLSAEARQSAERAPTIADVVTRMLTLAEPGPQALVAVGRKLGETPLLSRVWKDVLSARMPKIMMFGESDMVPSAIALDDLRDPEKLKDPGVATAAALLDVAGLTAEDLDPDTQSHEELRSRIENAALGVTEELRRFWTQDDDLEVLVEVTSAGARDFDFTPGTPVLRIRVGSRKERVSLPLAERSRGFNWFFSFLVRLAHLGNHASSLIILLDEPGRSLHALAQADFLHFVRMRLAPDHQLVFATHSPFLLDPARLDSVRVVLRPPGKTTVVTADLSAADDDTLMPLRAVVRGDLADATLPRGPSLIVRDPAELMWLRAFSEQVQKRKKGGLDPRWSIVPVGGAAGLIELALASGHAGRQAVALFDPAPDERDAVKHLAQTQLVDSQRFFSIGAFFGQPGAVLEDLIDVQYWLALVREQHRLDPPINDTDLPSDGNILERTATTLLRRKLAFDRLGMADLGLRRLGSAPVPPSTIDRFARLFDAVNALMLPSRTQPIATKQG